MFRNILPVFGLLLLGAATCVFADEELNLQDLKDQLPGDITDNTDVPPKKGEEIFFRTKCLINSGSDEAFRKASKARDDMNRCLSSVGSFNELKQEVEAVMPHGELKPVFKKYCAKSSDFKQCFFTFTATIEPCLDEQERANKVTFENVADSFIDFICHNEGERTALFFAEEGPQYLVSKGEEMKNCFNTTLSKYMPSGQITMDNLPRTVFDSEQCQDIQSFQNCVVGELEKCEKPTPANIIESLFKFINKQMPCASETEI